MNVIAIAAFLGGLLLAVRVMFFGVQQVSDDRLRHRRWPLALATFLMTGGALLYVRARAAGVTASWLAVVLLVAFVLGAGAWWLVQRSSAIPSTDPEDDPRFRFQGHVARVTQPIGSGAGSDQGRISFEFDGQRFDFRARWSTSGESLRTDPGFGAAGSEVVIEIVEGDLAYVEPWAVVEERL